MAIHYTGRLQATPGRRACGATNGQADARSWHATDCADCINTLIKLPVRWVGRGYVAGYVKDVTKVGHSTYVGIPWVNAAPADDEVSHGVDTPSLYEFENSWELSA